ncbi:MAG: flagellar basal body L-ring protein FlgH [Planctomycetota bacterium]
MKVMKVLGLSLASVLMFGAEVEAQNLYARTRAPRTLVGDNTARFVGDILTIRVLEEHRIRDEDDVERNNSTSLAARLEAFTLDDNAFRSELPRIDIRQERGFTGESRARRERSFEARVAVVVVDVLPNDNLIVSGTRTVRVDDETKTLQISGIVRRLDVLQDNTVVSSQVADARIAIVGEGGATRVTTRGPVGRFFDTLVWAAWPF